MRALPWIIAGVGIGVGVTILLFNESEPDYATDYNVVEHAARKTFNWGTKRRAEGKVGSVAGAIKEGVGKLTADYEMVDEGAADRVTGKVSESRGKVVQVLC